MPELPEVETTIRGLRKKVRGRTFLDVWTDAPKLVKRPEEFSLFRKEIRGLSIEKVRRRAKYIVFELSRDKVLLIHQKMTGHLLYGKWEKKQRWVPAEEGAMEDRFNSYIHLLFKLDNGWMLALSDLRKFARVELWDKAEFEKKDVLGRLGPEPFSLSFSEFEKLFKGRRGRIKSLLMNQEFISGIGNIYSDEILWKARINPFRKADTLEKKELKRIYKAMLEILKEAVERKGTSISDYRTLEGEEGGFESLLKVYAQEEKKCPRCGRRIVREKIGARSTRYCPDCQPRG